MLSQNIKDALQTLGFTEVPSMTQLREAFLKRCLESHPDKGGNEEDFKSLIEAKETISVFIKNNIPEDATNKDEVLARKQYSECNVISVNSSLSVKILYNI